MDACIASDLGQPKELQIKKMLNLPEDLRLYFSPFDFRSTVTGQTLILQNLPPSVKQKTVLWGVDILGFLINCLTLRGKMWIIALF